LLSLGKGRPQLKAPIGAFILSDYVAVKKVDAPIGVTTLVDEAVSRTEAARTFPKPYRSEIHLA
jgi:hypothetical protein